MLKSEITSSGSDESEDSNSSEESLTETSSDESISTLPIYRELIFYSPPEPELPQPTEDIMVPL